MKKKEFKIQIVGIFFIFFIIFVTFYITRASFPSNTTKNIADNKLLYWGAGWKNNQSNYSGSELGFIFKNSRRISFEFTTDSKADQGAEILIDYDKYLIGSPNLNSQQLSISVNNNKPHTVKIRHFCTSLYHPCSIKLVNVYLDNHSELIPYKSNKKILSVLGDSISTIYGKENYSFILADSLGYELHNASIMGSTVSKVKDADSAINRYKKDLKPFKSDMTIISLGTNDVANNVSLDVFENNYSAIVENVKKWNSQNKVFLAGILPREDINYQVINVYNELIKKISQKHNVYFLDTSNWLDNNDFSDKIHPSIEAQKKLSEKFLKTISAILK